jgi:hypothetical protein
MFIEKINFNVDLDQMLLDLTQVEKEVGWPEKMFTHNNRSYHANQIGLTHRPESEQPWFDASGSLYDKEQKHFIGKESDFTEWNGIGEYTRSIIEDLSNQVGIHFGRIRYMKLLPKTGLSVHHDFEPRYHLVLKTNPHAYFLDCTQEGDVQAKAYHVPADGYFYKVDTLRNHSVFNGGWEPRIHLVLAEYKTD